jgi:hypothetical protein
MDEPIKISPQLLAKAGASTVRWRPGTWFSETVMRPTRCMS